jgi:hypothetical protein
VATKGFLKFLAGVNVAIIILDILLALAALIALFSAVVDNGVGIGIAAILAALAVIVLLLDCLAKWAHENAEASTDAQYQRLLSELKRKQKELEGKKTELTPQPPG